MDNSCSMNDFLINDLLTGGGADSAQGLDNASNSNQITRSLESVIGQRSPSTSETTALDSEQGANSAGADLRTNAVQTSPKEATKAAPNISKLAHSGSNDSPPFSSAPSALESHRTIDTAKTISWPNIEEDLPDLSIESSFPQLQSNREKLSGRRIVNIAHFIQSIRELDRHDCPNSAEGQFVYKCERAVGLWSEFTFACEKCHRIRTVTTDPVREPTPLQGKKDLGINDSAVWGFMSIGGGHANLEEVLSGIGIPPMSKGAFYRREESLGKRWEGVLYEEMIQAGREEKRIAEEAGQFCEDGVTPYIAVVVDGGWSHRSHGHRYLANSGVAVVIGQKTKKLLYLAVRNKVCSTCEYFMRADAPVKQHTCYKNWDKCSAAMEQDIIVEGFQRSVEMHGLQYRIFIGDGDSSVHHQIVSRVDYGHLVVKRECANHVVKCYTTRLYKIAKASKGNSQYLSGPKIKRIKNGARKAISHYATALKSFEGSQDDMKTLESQLTKSLAEDLINGPKHVFGSHEKCKSYFCDGARSDDILKKIPYLLMVQILSAANSISEKSSRLITDDTSNLAESVMSLVAKLSGGKQVNRGQRGSYQHRCYGAGLNFQLGAKWHYVARKAITCRSPVTPLKKYCDKMARVKQAKNMRRRQLITEYDHQQPPAKKRLCDETQKFYGQHCEKPDMPSDQHSAKAAAVLNELHVDVSRRDTIEKATRGQSTNGVWHVERKMRLTASHFHSVCTRQDSTPCDALVKQILHSKGFSCAAMQHGIDNEPVALSLYEDKEKVVVQPCGLFVDIEYGFLGASPDGLVGDEGIVEVKCPYSRKDLSPFDAAKMFNPAGLKDGRPALSKTHRYYYQIQGQLHITGRDFCDFVVCTTQGIDIQRVERDDTFWKQKMKSKLVRFYKECLLPEIVDSRVERNMPVRRPQWNDAAIAAKTKVLEARKLKSKEVDKAVTNDLPK